MSPIASCLSSCPIVNVLMAVVVAPGLTAHFINKHQGQKELWGEIVIASNSNNFEMNVEKFHCTVWRDVSHLKRSIEDPMSVQTFQICLKVSIQDPVLCSNGPVHNGMSA